MSGRFEVGASADLRALHRIPWLPPPEGELHAHDYRVEVVVRGDTLSPDGMLLDLDQLNAALSDCLAELDSADLDQLPSFAGVNTTVEMVAAHIWEQVRDRLPAGHGLGALRVTLFETADAWASIDRPLEG